MMNQERGTAHYGSSRSNISVKSAGAEIDDIKKTSIVRSKSEDPNDFRIRVVQYDDNDVDICFRYYEEDESASNDDEPSGYNYHDFSHSTWYDYRREKSPMPPPISTQECDDIRLCLPFQMGITHSLKRCTAGVLSGWGFTASPREPWKYYLKEMLSGIVCGMTILPEIISFAFIAGVPPHVALHGTWIVCFCATIFGGSPGIMSGVSGSFAAIAGQYSDGVGNPNFSLQIARMLLAVMLAGVFLIIFSFFHLASLSQFISTSVIIGYSNGLAIIIAIAQFHGFQDITTHEYITGLPLTISIIYCILAFLLMQFSDHIPKIGRFLPPALIAVLVVVGLHYGIMLPFVTPDIKIMTVGDVAKLTPETSLPNILFLEYKDAVAQISFLDVDFWKQIGIFTGSIMLEALIIADILRTLGGCEPNSNQQFMSLGLGNCLSACFGSLGGSSMVGITIMNFKMGAKGKESNLFTGFFIFVMMVGGYPVLNYIPIPCLCGIMFSVSGHCFKWFSVPMVLCSALPASIRNLHPRMHMKITRSDAFIIFAVTIFCVTISIPFALLAGMVIAAFAYVWESKRRFKIEMYNDAQAKIKYYEIEGNIFYASKRVLTRVFTPELDPPTTVIVLLPSSTLFDYTAIETLNSLKAEYASCNKTLLIKGLSHGCIKKVAKMNHLCRHMEHDLIGIETPNLPTVYSRFKNKIHRFIKIPTSQVDVPLENRV
ncbi:bifunctional SLC26A-SulP transporter domain/STAS domain superfamily [Babesia duncani]|uniref:Bifunctional SLC26A-SulP transporter domain/STAS domain superfamily n=1 Tax=Babesia duncani TaxID=323732 RepID=A0AAD9UN79_9APIC|nr:bifunctional SLC26A-SulP transporter domain/STAS domain superfamily [Babesia duncani]